MSGEITKEEILLMIEMQGKSAAAMENIANSLRQIAEHQKDIFAKLNNGLGKSITEAVSKEFAGCIANCTAHGILMGKVKTDTGWMKWTFGAVAVVVAVALVVLKFLAWMGSVKP